MGGGHGRGPVPEPSQEAGLALEEGAHLVGLAGRGVVDIDDLQPAHRAVEPIGHPGHDAHGAGPGLATIAAGTATAALATHGGSNAAASVFKWVRPTRDCAAYQARGGAVSGR